MTTVWSDQPPPRYEVIHEAGDDMCTVVFYTSARSIPTPDGDVVYHSNMIALTVAYSAGTLADIRENYSEWLAMAAEAGGVIGGQQNHNRQEE